MGTIKDLMARWKATPDYQKRRVKIVISGISALVSVILSISAVVVWAGAAADVSTTSDLWTDQPLEDITALPVGSECASGWSPLTVSHPGFAPLCDCRAVSKPEFKGKTFFRQTEKSRDLMCNTNQTQAGCKGYPGTAAGDFPIYATRLVCVKRMDPAARARGIDRVRVFGAGAQCPNGTRRCAQAYSGPKPVNPRDDPVLPDQEFSCISSDFPCPLTDFRETTTPNAPEFANYSCTQAWAASWLCKARFGDVNPIVSPRIQTMLPPPKDNDPCKPGLSSSASRADDDPLRGSLSYCSSSNHDWRWQSGHVGPPELQLWTENNAPAIDREFARSGVSYSLLYRREPPWKRNCVLPRSFVIDSDPEIQKLATAQTVQLVFAILIALVVNVGIGCWEFGQKDDDGWEDDTKQQKTVRRVRIWILVVGSAVKLTTLAIALGIANDLGSDLRKLKKGDCTDSITNSTFDFLAEKTESMRSLNGAMMALAILDVLLNMKTMYRSFFPAAPKAKTNPDPSRPQSPFKNLEEEHGPVLEVR